MHQSFEDECLACNNAPFMWCIACQARDLFVQSLPVTSVSDFWTLAREIMFAKKP